MQAPKEDPAVVADREREREIAERERAGATQDLAAGLTSDFRRAYMPMSLFKVRG
jgi:hypothetical protein